MDGPDLLPIDEDIDDEQCSPIKPKKRMSEDSPFKNKQWLIEEDKQMIDGGNHEKIKGFGAELDCDKAEVEYPTVHLDS